MSKRTLAVLSLGIFAVLLFSSAGCVSKKHLRAVEQENAQQLAQANERIGELEKGNDALNKDLAATKSSLEGAQAKTKELSANVASLKDQLAGLEAQKAGLDEALAAGKETEASYQKKVRALNGSIGTLKKKVAEMESLVAAKDAEIAALQRTEASLKAAAEEESKRMAALNADKDALATQLDQANASKKRTTLILGILLAVAVLLAIVGFVLGRKKAA
jgi:chromosome segregation ATPase